jgi:hypothetical protein
MLFHLKPALLVADHDHHFSYSSLYIPGEIKLIAISYQTNSIKHHNDQTEVLTELYFET